ILLQCAFTSFLLSVFCNSFPQNTTTDNILKLKEIVYTLSADSMIGRSAGGEGEIIARTFLLKFFQETGLSPFEGTYFQEFTFPKDSSHLDTAYNVYGYIDNKSDSTIVVGAHYDHIGFGGPKSRSLANNKVHNGADDNASGVAMMLLLAENFSKSEIQKYNFLFIAFSAHEDGLFGSFAFVKGKKHALSNVKLMINMDMVGRLDTIEPFLKVIRKDSNVYFDSLLSKIDHQKFRLLFTDNNISHTDASVFAKQNIPTLSFTTGMHDDYHKVSDDPEKINYDGMCEISNYIISLLVELNRP
ncbi:MAG: DUF4910 domain-containing protein, partial [Bacteroidetes bacterium]|nr:DUF4910 domain-containing protein [Bacteroidota bacterium]